MDKDVWYCAYGSNLDSTRFAYYLFGGELNGRTYSGCEKATIPVESYRVLLDHSLVMDRFAYLMNETGTVPVCGRMYRVSAAQFAKIKQQEGYPDALQLGEVEDLPVLSFTDLSKRMTGIYTDYRRLLSTSIAKLKFQQASVVDQCLSQLPQIPSEGHYTSIDLSGLNVRHNTRQQIQEGLVMLDQQTIGAPIVKL